VRILWERFSHVPRFRITATLAAALALLGPGSVWAAIGAASSSVAITPTAIRINAGGGSYTDASGQTWLSDRYYLGGSPASTSKPVSLTADQPLYQTERWGMSAYNVPVPVPGTYKLRLHLAETSFSSAGARVMAAKAEGKPILTGFDIWASTGASRPVVIETPVNISDGTLNIDFTASANFPKVNAIEVLSQTPAPSPSPPAMPTPIRINAAGPAYTDHDGRVWAADNGFTGGNLDQTSDVISGTPDAGLYRNSRWAMSAYAWNVPNGTYRVTLRMIEDAFSYAGGRVFSVTAEGNMELRDLDLYAMAGHDVAVDRGFEVTVNDGHLDLGFSASIDNAIVSAIEVLPTSSSTPQPTPTMTPSQTPSDDKRTGFATGYYLAGENDGDRRHDIAEMAAGNGRYVRYDWYGPQSNQQYLTTVDEVAAAGMKTDALITGVDTSNFSSDVKTFALASIPHGVAVFELWNEPNLGNGVSSPADYVNRVLKPGYTAIKAAGQQLGVPVTVLLCGLAPGSGSADPIVWMRSIYANGGRPFFDAANIHPYTWPGSPVAGDVSWNTFLKVQTIRDIMVQNGDDGKMIWATEIGWPSGGGPGAVDEATQAQMVNAFIVEWFDRYGSFSGPVLWYTLREQSQPGTEGYFGIEHKDFNHKPAYAALKAAFANVS
jgi:hypothetical protein